MACLPENNLKMKCVECSKEIVDNDLGVCANVMGHDIDDVRKVKFCNFKCVKKWLLNNPNSRPLFKSYCTNNVEDEYDMHECIEIMESRTVERPLDSKKTLRNSKE